MQQFVIRYMIHMVDDGYDWFWVCEIAYHENGDIRDEKTICKCMDESEAKRIKEALDSYYSNFQ